MNQKNLFNDKKSRNRLFVLEGLIYSVFLVLVVRAITIHFSSFKPLEKIAQKQYSSSIKLGNYRGSIFDRRGNPMALSVKKPSVAINPKVFAPSDTQSMQLSKLLSISNSKLLRLSVKNSYFAWLKRHTSNELIEKIDNLNIRGLYILYEPSRFYPSGSASSHVIGKVDIDNHGLFGIEYLLDDVLKKDPEKIITVRDGLGNMILQNYQEITPEKPGNTVNLTIDSYIQAIIAEELAVGLHKAQAKSGFVIVGDPFSGAILGLVSMPSYDPNLQLSAKYQPGFDMQSTKNKAISDIFEPGSVIKPFVLAEALKLGLTTVDYVYDFDKSGVYRLDRGTISDDHPKEQMTSAEILIHSSNIGSFYHAQKIGPEGLWELYKRIGVGSKQSIKGLSPIVAGSISPWKSWHPVRFANVSFGQGFSVNGLDLLKIYNVFASGGRFTPLHLISKVTDSDGADIAYRTLYESSNLYDPKIISQVSDILHRVTTEGSGSLAQTRSYSVAGKTGTSEIFDREIKAYSKDKRIASFAGYAPYSDPKITVVVVIDQPKNKPYYGGKWAAPVFSKVVERSLNYLGVPGDKAVLEELSQLSASEYRNNSNDKHKKEKNDKQDKLINNSENNIDNQKMFNSFHAHPMNPNLSDNF